MKKHLMRAVSLLTVVLLTCTGFWASADRPRGYDSNGCMPLITEPGECAQPLIFCRGDQDLTIDQINWVDAGRGKAVRFGGVDEYFRIGYNSLQLVDFTLSMWVKWEGAADAEGGSGEYEQRIFSARGTYRDRQYITLSPLESTAAGEDGLRLHMRYEASDWEVHAQEVAPLEKSTWHHVAVVGTAHTIAVYVDGVAIGEVQTMMSLAQMRPQQLYLGKGPTAGGDGYFNGLMDNVYLYKRALAEDELANIIANQRPVEPTTTTTIVGVQPQETVPDVDMQTDYSLPMVPSVVWIVSGAVAVLIVIFIVSVNIRYAKQKRK